MLSDFIRCLFVPYSSCPLSWRCGINKKQYRQFIPRINVYFEDNIMCKKYVLFCLIPLGVNINFGGHKLTVKNILSLRC